MIGIIRALSLNPPSHIRQLSLNSHQGLLVYPGGP